MSLRGEQLRHIELMHAERFRLPPSSLRRFELFSSCGETIFRSSVVRLDIR